MPGQHLDTEKRGGKARLLKAAQYLVQERPFDEITIDEIIKRARLSRPAFYYHFAGGKEELRIALIQRGVLPETPSQDVRLAVLKAALRVYARSGISAATLDDIANEAGVTRGTLCWHFHSKDDLLTALIKHYGPHSLLEPAINQIKEDLQNGVQLDDETVLRRLATAFYDAFNEQGDYTRLAVLLLYTHPEMAHILSEKIATGRKGIIEYLHKRRDEGYLRADIDPTFLVQVMAMTFAMRAISRGLYSQLPLESFPREVVIDQLVSLLLYGIVRREAPVQTNE
ncbi:MAG TPA: TetR/AcrR family transcriptional regulator [Ktedonobacteraceae bacterium]|nr:TetR/AcrR family transcriptional regulator [Ktedonobacteraceae bacterium]